MHGFCTSASFPRRRSTWPAGRPHFVVQEGLSCGVPPAFERRSVQWVVCTPLCAWVCAPSQQHGERTATNASIHPPSTHHQLALIVACTNARVQARCLVHVASSPFAAAAGSPVFAAAAHAAVAPPTSEHACMHVSTTLPRARVQLTFCFQTQASSPGLMQQHHNSVKRQIVYSAVAQSSGLAAQRYARRRAARRFPRPRPPYLPSRACRLRDAIFLCAWHIFCTQKRETGPVLCVRLRVHTPRGCAPGLPLVASHAHLAVYQAHSLLLAWQDGLDRGGGSKTAPPGRPNCGGPGALWQRNIVSNVWMDA